MNNRERMKKKIEVEADQWKRLFLMIQYACEYCSTEQKKSLEKFLMDAAGYREKAEV